MSIKSTLSIPLLLLVAAPAVAQDSRGGAERLTIAVKPNKPAKPKIVCRSEAHTGSRVSQSVCLPVDEWQLRDEAEEEATKQGLDRLNRQRSTILPKDGPYNVQTMGPNG